MKDYAKFRTWLVSKVVEGATPKEVANWCRTYRDRFAESAEPGWADGLLELPSELEITMLEAMDGTWEDYHSFPGRDIFGPLADTRH